MVTVVKEQTAWKHFAGWNCKLSISITNTSDSIQLILTLILA